MPDDIELLDGTPLADIYGYREGWASLGEEIAREITGIMASGDVPRDSVKVEHDMKSKGRDTGPEGRERPSARH